jgi:tRNA nucleotidyltransferase (CCA-adding enzyme)
MQQMVRTGEADFLVPERVWQEFSRGLTEPRPELMFEVMQRTGLLAKAFPEIKAWPGRFSGSVPVRFAVLAWPLGQEEVQALCERLRSPGDVRELALAAVRNRDGLRKSTPEALLGVLKGADAFRRPERFAELLEAARLAEPGVDTARIERARAAAARVDAGSIAGTAQGADIGRLVDEARLKAIRELG